MAGLLAARMFRQLGWSVLVFEAQSSLPNNHSAVLRFRSPAVGDVAGIPFKRVTMLKAAIAHRNPVADALSYSRKTSGVARSDRSFPFEPVSAERWIAPDDFITRLAEEPSMAVFNQIIGAAIVDEWKRGRRAVVSTIPMPALMEMLGYPGRDAIGFRSRKGVNLTATLPRHEAYVSLYDPDPSSIVHRMSITGDRLHIETNPDARMESVAVAEVAAVRASWALGIGLDAGELVAHKSLYAKILPIEEGARRDFIAWATAQHGVFSLGRFATWRPGLLLDDLVKDIRLIVGWAERQGRYAAMRAS